MIVYNTTFHVEKEAQDECLDYLKREYIPNVVAGGFMQAPCLRRVLNAEAGEGSSYSVQFYVKNVDTLNYWYQQEGAAIHKALAGRFGEKVVGFSTLLEDINWEE